MRQSAGAEQQRLNCVAAIGSTKSANESPTRILDSTYHFKMVISTALLCVVPLRGHLFPRQQPPAHTTQQQHAQFYSQLYSQKCHRTATAPSTVLYCITKCTQSSHAPVLAVDRLHET